MLTENSKNSVTIFVDPLMLIALLLAVPVVVEVEVAAFWRCRTRVACILLDSSSQAAGKQGEAEEDRGRWQAEG